MYRILWKPIVIISSDLNFFWSVVEFIVYWWKASSMHCMQTQFSYLIFRRRVNSFQQCWPAFKFMWIRLFYEKFSGLNVGVRKKREWKLKKRVTHMLEYLEIKRLKSHRVLVTNFQVHAQRHICANRVSLMNCVTVRNIIMITFSSKWYWLQLKVDKSSTKPILSYMGESDANPLGSGGKIPLSHLKHMKSIGLCARF